MNTFQFQPYWIKSLLFSNASTFNDLLGPSNTFNFGYPTTVRGYSSNADANQFLQFNEQQKVFSRAALAYVQTIIDVQFIETTDVDKINTISFANNTQAVNSNGYSYRPSASFAGSDVFLNRNVAGNLTPKDETREARTLIHEIGHALGLKHPFDDGTGVSSFLPTAENSGLFTALSYNTANKFQLAFADFDIAALQYIYGPSQTARTGNDRYVVNAATSNFIWDGVGTDTLDASAQTAAATLYLEPGYWGFIGAKSTLISAPGQVTINFGSVIENLIGGRGNDTLVGNSANNVITGGVGNDSIYGAGGIDTASYSGLHSNYIVSRTTRGFTVTDRSGAEGIDNLTQVERLQFSDETVALDINGAEVYRIYQAAFNRRPDSSGLVFWMDARNNGQSLITIANNFVNSAEFQTTYGTNPTNSEYVNRLYDNVLHRPGEIEGVAHWLSVLNSQALTKAEVLAGFSESLENQVALAGVIQIDFIY